MLAVFLITAVILLLCVLGLGVNILHGKEFPHYDVGSNEEMRRRGIRCYKDEDAALQRDACGGNASEACKDCKLYEHSSDSRKA